MSKATRATTEQNQDNIGLAAPHIPLPKKENKRLLQAEVNFELFNEAQKEMKKRGLKIRQVVEFGLSAFVKASKNTK